jgi:hypothetical protein
MLAAGGVCHILTIGRLIKVKKDLTLMLPRFGARIAASPESHGRNVPVRDGLARRRHRRGT